MEDLSNSINIGLSDPRMCMMGGDTWLSVISTSIQISTANFVGKDFDAAGRKTTRIVTPT